MSADESCRTVADLLGVPEVPKQGRGRLIVTAIELFYRNGFNAIGLDRVIATAGVSKTTFYKHFDSKVDLMVAALQWRDRWEVQAWDRAVRQLAGDNAKGQLRAMFEVMDIWFSDPDFGGCMFINAAAEFPNPNDPVHRAAAAHKHTNRNAVRDMAERAGLADTDHFADVYTTLLEGTLVMRQVYGRDDAARVSLPIVDQLIAQHLDGDA